MTESLPAVVDSTPREIARADTDSWTNVIGQVAKFAEYVAGTEFVPRSMRDSAPAVTAAIMYGREVGLPPMTSLTQTHVIEGKPSLSANAMRALVLAAGHEIQTLESTGAIVRMRGRRRGSQEWGAEVVWTIDMARAAGLLGKNNWKNYPRQMLTARCSAELCTRDFPDVTLGFSSIEELEDLGQEERTLEQAAAPAPRTRVARKSTPAARKTAAALPAAAPARVERPPAPAGPPLPGEEGYDQGADVSDESPADGQSPEDGSTEDTPAPAEPQPEQTTDAPDEPVTDAPEQPVTEGPRKASQAQTRMIFASLKGLNVDEERAERLLIVGTIIGRELESFSDLTLSDAKTVIDTLARCQTRAQLDHVLDKAEARNGGQSE